MKMVIILYSLLGVCVACKLCDMYTVLSYCDIYNYSIILLYIAKKLYTCSRSVVAYSKTAC